MKIRNKFIFIIVLMSLTLSIFTNTSFGASISAFNEWVEKNKEELSILLDGYDYVIVNNFYQDKIRMYYTRAKNNKFYFNEESPFYGDRRFLRSKSDLGNSYFYYYTFNPNRWK